MKTTVGQPTMTDLLLSIGIERYTVPLALQFAFMLPTTTDPDAQGVMLIVEGLQRKLFKLGYPVVGRADGILGPSTAHAIELVSGPNWQMKTWGQLVNDAVHARPMRRASIVGTFPNAAGALGFVDPDQWGHTSRGSCKPKNTSTLATFKNLQHQVNRMLAGLNSVVVIAEDGIVGGLTVDAVKQIGVVGGSKLTLSTRAAIATITTCDSLARIADALATKLSSAANGLGAPETTKPKPARVTPVVKRDPRTGKEQLTFPLTTAGMLQDPLILGAMGIGAALIWQFSKGKPKKKSRKRKR